MYRTPKQIAFSPVVGATLGYKVSIHDAGTDSQIAGRVLQPVDAVVGADGYISIDIPEAGGWRTADDQLCYVKVAAINEDGTGPATNSANYATEVVLELPGPVTSVLVR